MIRSLLSTRSARDTWNAASRMPSGIGPPVVSRTVFTGSGVGCTCGQTLERTRAKMCRTWQRIIGLLLHRVLVSERRISGAVSLSVWYS